MKIQGSSLHGTGKKYLTRVRAAKKRSVTSDRRKMFFITLDKRKRFFSNKRYEEKILQSG